MIDNKQNEKPCLVKTEQGFSVMYKNRSLYSKYKPDSAILRMIESLNILEQTLILCFSPVLGYGLEELLKKLPNNCFILLIEKDFNLYEFSLSYIEKILKNNENLNNSNSQKIFYAFVENEKTFFNLFINKQIPPFSNFKRCQTIEFSGGAKLEQDFYKNITSLCDDAISRFWKNRITLVKMGRLYARNLLKNLSKLPFSTPLIEKSINRPILVCASGPSLDLIIEKIKNCAEFFFIIAVDNAFLPLLKNGIIPDSVIAVESQLANEKAFLGTAKSGINLIADLTSRPHILSILGGQVSFFLSEYENCRYINRIINAGIFPFLKIMPLGSVGLSAVEIALNLRCNASLPIFFAGLDFCYTPNKSHCKESVFHRNKLNCHNRLNPVENSCQCFGANNFYIQGKNGIFITEPALNSYGETFKMRYSKVPNLFDISPIGMDTNCSTCTVEQMAEYGKIFAQQVPVEMQKMQTTQIEKIENAKGTKNFQKNESTQKNQNAIKNYELFNKIKRYYIEEIEQLEELKQLLINGGNENRILNLIEEREYLYLHFADAYNPITIENTSMLKRIRSEIDFFLKDLKIALKNMEEEIKVFK